MGCHTDAIMGWNMDTPLEWHMDLLQDSLGKGAWRWTYPVGITAGSTAPTPSSSSCPWHSPARTHGWILVTYGCLPEHFPKFSGLYWDNPCGCLPTGNIPHPMEMPPTPTLTTALPAAGMGGIFGIHAGLAHPVPVAWLSMHKWPSMHPDTIWGANYREHTRNRGNYSRKLAV